MNKCPNCYTDNEEGSNYCFNCMEDLRYNESVSTERLLITLGTEEEALVLEGLLKSVDIYFYRRTDKVGDFLKGDTGNAEAGINIYVSEKDYSFAKELIDSDPVDFEVDHEEEQEELRQENNTSHNVEPQPANPLPILIAILILLYLMFR